MIKLEELEQRIVTAGERRAETAQANGCRVRWADGGLPMPYCACEDQLHFGGQQSSYLSEESAQRRRLH